MKSTMSVTSRRLASFYQTAVGKKAVMAVTGLILFLWLVLHVLGNLQIFLGRDQINRYSAFLHATPEALWPVRIILIVAIVLHINSAVLLYLQKVKNRPIGYTKKGNRGATVMSRTMMWSGFALLVFIILHLLHMTTGTIHKDFIAGDVFHNLTFAFHQPTVVALYVLAMALLAMHLYHGLYSFTQSLGVSNPRHTSRIKPLAAAFAIVMASLFALVPIAVLAGFVH
jgi:succinate dehydrogenase / fumarate reductase cytochrome b subunit